MITKNDMIKEYRIRSRLSTGEDQHQSQGQYPRRGQRRDKLSQGQKN